MGDRFRKLDLNVKCLDGKYCIYLVNNILKLEWDIFFIYNWEKIKGKDIRLLIRG